MAPIIITKSRKKTTIKEKRLKTMNERYELNKNLAQMLKGGVIMMLQLPSKQ